MIAELNGKISSNGSNLSDKLEDKLTGDFFGALRYISFNKVMKQILKRTNIMGHCKLSIIDIISNIDAEYWADNISFWPYNRLGEFDLTLEFKEILIGIEVKLYSGLSSDDDVDQIIEDIEVRSINQLSRESRILRENIQCSNKSAILIFIAPENYCKSICNDVYSRNIIDDRIELGYLSWEEILEGMKQINLEAKLNDYEKLIVDDLISLLKRKGLERFRSFNFRSVDIDKQLWFNFDTKLYGDIEFVYDKTIEGESYYEFR